jgi:hypothetical protein
MVWEGRVRGVAILVTAAVVVVVMTSVPAWMPGCPINSKRWVYYSCRVTMRRVRKKRRMRRKLL